MRVCRVVLGCSLFSMGVGASGWAQTSPAAPDKPSAAAPEKTSPAATDKGDAVGAQSTLSLQAKLVNLPVVVRDNKGKLIQTLTKTDFALNVDGKPQVIRYFDRDNDLPLTLGLLVDVSQSQRSVLEQERTASEKFLEDMLEGGDKAKGKAPDRAFVIQFAHETELLQDLTDSKPKLQAALKELDTPSPNHSQSDPNDTSGSDNSGSGGGSSRRGGRGGGTVMYDALFLSADEIMTKQTGRKALVVLTDGVDNGSRKSLARAIEAVQRGDTIVYAIYFKGEEPRGDNGNRAGGGYPGGGRRGGGGGYPGGGGGGYPGGGGGGYPGGGQRGGGGGGESRADGKKTLERIAGETGGRMFEVTKKQDAGAIYGVIAEELRSQYRLGYTPDAAAAADGYHQVDLQVPAQKKLVVQTRDGYYTGK